MPVLRVPAHSHPWITSSAIAGRFLRLLGAETVPAAGLAPGCGCGADAAPLLLPSDAGSSIAVPVARRRGGVARVSPSRQGQAACCGREVQGRSRQPVLRLSLIHISEPT